MGKAALGVQGEGHQLWCEWSQTLIASHESVRSCCLVMILHPFDPKFYVVETIFKWSHLKLAVVAYHSCFHFALEGTLSVRFINSPESKESNAIYTSVPALPLGNRRKSFPWEIRPSVLMFFRKKSCLHIVLAEVPSLMGEAKGTPLYLACMSKAPDWKM